MISYDPYLKRAFDVVVSLLALLGLLPLFVVLMILIRLDSKGSPFFIQERIGRRLQPFRLIKFRSMAAISEAQRHQFEPGTQHRVTRIGKILRATKLDELPELLNILKGDMSLVGPRPEVPKYVQVYPDLFREVLRVRPGLSDYASIKYRHEEELLAQQTDPDAYYRTVILPDKLRLARDYAQHPTLRTDLTIIATTLRCIFTPMERHESHIGKN